MRRVAALVAVCLLAPLLGAEVVEQLQGNAVLRFEVGSVEDGAAQLRLSDVLELTITVEGNYPLQFPANDPILLEEQLRAFRAAGAWHHCEGETQRTRLGSRERWRQTIHLDPLKPGEVKLPLQPLAWTEGPAQQPHTARWEPIRLVVTADVAQFDPAAVRGVPGPEQVPPASRWWLPWLLGLGGLVIGTGLILGGWGLKRLLTVPPAPPLPHEWALRELKHIEGLSLSAERSHTLLSDVLRRYLELRFELPATKQTTTEFLQTVRALPQLTSAQQERLRAFLERCDLAKFAPIEMAAEECQATATLARQLVEETAALSPSAPAEASR